MSERAIRERQDLRAQIARELVRQAAEQSAVLSGAQLPDGGPITLSRADLDFVVRQVLAQFGVRDE